MSEVDNFYNTYIITFVFRSNSAMSMVGAPKDAQENRQRNRRKSSIFLNIFTFGQTTKCQHSKEDINSDCGCKKVPEIANLDEV